MTEQAFEFNQNWHGWAVTKIAKN